MLSMIWCVGSVLASTMAVGVPLRWLLNRMRPLGKAEWREAPRLGASAATLPLHNLIYFDVPIRRAVPWLCLAAATLWLLMLLRRQVLPTLRTCPVTVFLAALVVL